jgi:adenylate cyclase class 2
MTYKNVSDGNSILGTKEVNVEVDSYDNAILFLKGCGLEVKAYQETKREVWQLDGVEFCIDTWPWLPTYLEIEGPTEESVWEMAKRLGFDKSESKIGSADAIYQHYYGVDPDVVNFHTPEISFEMEPPEWVKNKD